MNLSPLRIARVSKALTQAEVAERVGISLATYQRIEVDPDRASVRRAHRIADVLETDYYQSFFTDDDCGGLDVE